MFLKEENDGVIYPYNYQNDYPYLVIPQGENYPEGTIYWVFSSPMPEVATTEKVIEIDPEKIGRNYYQKWAVEPKTAEEIRQLVPMVAMNQAKKALLRGGKLQAVDEVIAAVGGEAAIDWEYATEVHRESPLVLVFTSQLGWSEDEVNALFQLAVTL